MTNPIALIAQTQGIIDSDELNFKDLDPNDLLALIGAPPVKLSGLDSFVAKRKNPKAKLFCGLSGGGTFLTNKNLSGEIRLTFFHASWSLGHIEAFDEIGAPFPIVTSDLGCGGTSTVVASKCKVIDKGEWKRGNVTKMIDIVLECPVMFTFHGFRLVDV